MILIFCLLNQGEYLDLIHTYLKFGGPNFGVRGVSGTSLSTSEALLTPLAPKFGPPNQ